MQSLQEVFQRSQNHKKNLKDLKAQLREALASDGAYKGIAEQMKGLRERKKQIEQTTKEHFAGELLKMDELDMDISSDADMMMDIALSMLAKGERIEVTDTFGNVFEPVFKVSFKKVK